MTRPSTGGHIRQFPRHKTAYRLISVVIDGVRRQRFEHRLVMEKVLGRPLARNEIVHHKDENGLNNDPGNLEITTQSEHVRHHLFVGPKKWNLEVAIELREGGATFEQMAKSFGVNAQSILMAFRRRGISTANKRHGTFKWDFELAKKQYEQGERMVDIARKAGVAAPSIRKAFLKHGVPLRKKLE